MVWNSFYINPLFILFIDYSFGEDPIEERFLRFRDSLNFEIKMKNLASDQALRKSFGRLFFAKDYLRTMGTPPENVPIAIITFALSFYLAINHENRIRFFYLFRGKIPAITQILFETLTVGPLGKENFVYRFALNNDYYETYIAARLSSTILDFNETKFNYFNFYLWWFQMLDHHHQSSRRDYLEFVDLDRVSLTTERPNYLACLSVHNGKIYWKKASYFNELPEERKKIYFMLAVALNCQSKEIGSFESFLEDTYSQKINFNEAEFTKQLFDFIVSGCVNQLQKPAEKKWYKNIRLINILMLLSLFLQIILLFFISRIFENF